MHNDVEDKINWSKVQHDTDPRLRELHCALTTSL